ncbi:MAG: NusA antitermination factor [Parcubacteria group bacterium GW2011_GWF2_39_13b]|nr:MAG: NusA antitermination factor [Parcubacteria group bacterium GW2011_GWF2_39_13b]
MDRDFLSAIEQICEERGIAKEKVLETIEMAIAAAYKKEHGRKGQNIRAKLDLVSGETKLFQVKLVVDESMLKPELEEGEEEEVYKEEELAEGEERKIRFNPERHIMIDEAKKLDKKIELKEEMLFSLEPDKNYGRIAAQTAKQVIIQRIREAEKEAVFEEYKGREGQVVSGVVQRIERGNVLIDLGRGNGILPQEEQIFGEYYRPGQRFRLYVLEVQRGPQGSMVLLSRVHPEMISRLFEIEVPEIAAGTVLVKGVAREAGSRSKIAVFSAEERIDPIGSLVGQKGTRVQAVINELGGEKIDIIQWDENPGKFVGNALSPAKVIDTEIIEAERKAIVKVPEDQLSLAIGKKGQNVRLAAKLTGWKVDIISAKGEKVEIEGEEPAQGEAVQSEKEAVEITEEDKKEEIKETAEETKVEEKTESKEEVKPAKEKPKKKGKKKKKTE